MGDTVGHYRVLDCIGRGGIGDVYRARDTKQGRTVAIKEVSPAISGDPASREAFLADAEAAARLAHPNIISLYEIVADGPDLFLVFDFATGESLKTMMGGRPLNPRRAVDLAIQIADALAEAHAQGVVHGDLKPDNVFVTPRGNAKILDFGLARWTRGGAARTGATQAISSADSAAALGTVAYLSPEQAVGERGDPRSDIFSLAVMLFEMLTGRLPFSGATPAATARQIAEAQPASVRASAPSLPSELDAIVSRALRKSAGDRYESAAVMAGELRHIAGLLDARATAAAAQRGRPVRVAGTRRSSRATWAVAAVLVAVLAAVAWWFFLVRPG